MLNAKRIKKHQKVNSVSRPILILDTRIHRKALCPGEKSDILFGNKSNNSVCGNVFQSLDRRRTHHEAHNLPVEEGTNGGAQFSKSAKK